MDSPLPLFLDCKFLEGRVYPIIIIYPQITLGVRSAYIIALYICIYVCIYICMYVYIYMYAYIYS
jgi:hypothetical protein